MSVVETRRLGRMSRREAEGIENQMTLSNRKRYGYRRVRGGYNAQLKASLIPNYTPGSAESIIFTLTCLVVAIVLGWVMVFWDDMVNFIKHFDVGFAQENLDTGLTTFKNIWLKCNQS